MIQALIGSKQKVLREKVYAGRGAGYPVSQADIDILQDPKRKPAYQGKIKLQEATNLALFALQQPFTRSQRNAVFRLEEFEKLRSWDGGVLIKTFNDIDLLLFRGILWDNIYLAWAEGGDMQKSAGVTCGPREVGRRCTILLSLHVLKDPRAELRDMWATMIHEMIHAYFMVECGKMESMELSHAMDPWHGPCYLKLMRAIRDKMGGYGRLPLSVKFYWSVRCCPADPAQSEPATEVRTHRRVRVHRDGGGVHGFAGILEDFKSLGLGEPSNSRNHRHHHSDRRRRHWP